MNWDADGNLPIGRPPVVRVKVLACMAKLKRARVARISEETGVCERTAHYVLNRAFENGELTRTKAREGRSPFYVYEVRDA